MSGLIPDIEHHRFRLFVLKRDNICQQSHLPRATAATAIDEVGFIADGIGALVVVKGQIKVPHRPRVHHLIVTFLIHIDTPVGVGIPREFTHKKMTQEGILVDITIQIPLHRIEMADDIILLLHGDGIFAGRLYDDRIAVVRPEP